MLFVWQSDTTIVTILSYVGFHWQLVTMSSAIGFIFMPSLSCESLNNWNLLISEVASRLGQTRRSPWCSLSASLQVLFVSQGVVAALAGFPLFGFIYPTMPIFLFGSLNASGLIDLPDYWILNTAIRVICYLVDVSIYGAVMLLMGFATQFIVTEISNLKTLFNDLM